MPAKGKIRAMDGSSPNGVGKGENLTDETVSTTAITSSPPPSTASTTFTTTAVAATSATSSDEETITSSTKPYEDSTPPPPPPSSSDSSSPPPSTSLSSGKTLLGVDYPPDDVGAFFGHPLTRATSALNGEDASAVALLHEYINLPAIVKEEPKEEEQLDGFLNIMSGPKPDPSLSHVQHGDDCSNLPPNTPPSDSNLQNDIQREVAIEEGVVVASNSGEVMVMPEYINMFLQEDFRLEKFLIDGQGDRQTESSPSDQGVEVTTVDLQQEDSDSAVTSATTKTERTLKKQNSHTVSRRVTETKRAPRKSRSKSDVTTHVTSTTNGVPRILTKCQATIVSHPPTSTELASTNFKDETVPEGAVLKELIAPPLPASINNTGVLVPASSIQCHVSNNNSNSGTFNTSTFSTESPVVVIHSTALPNHHQQQHLQQQQQQQQQHSNQQAIQQHHLSQIERQKQLHQVIVTSVPIIQNGDTKTTPVLINSSNSNTTCIGSNSKSNANSQVVSSKLPSLTRSYSLNAGSAQSKDVGSDTFAQLVKENSLLKKALSEKIRSRQAEVAMPSHVNNSHVTQHQFLTDDVPIMNIDMKYPPIKQEDAYPGFEAQYAYEPVTMTTCGDVLTNTDMTGLNTSIHHFNNPIDPASIHPHHCHLQQHQQLPPHCNSNNISNHNNGIIATSNNSSCITDSMIVHSQGQYFQVLQPLQPVESRVQAQSQQHNTVPISSSNGNTDANSNYYNYGYQQSLTPQLMETDKQAVVERYLQQQHHYTYANNNNSNTNGYTHFLNDNNYSMKSPDSGFHDTCPSPSAGTKVIPSHMPDPSTHSINGVLADDGTKEKIKKKKPTNSFSSSGSEKMTSRAIDVKKLDVNTTGYSYILESPISTTQRRDEDRVTYLNKSQYYGLTFNFSSQDRILKCSSVKSVIILVFREERPMEEERKAWEFWHGRQHSYKQRILDIDTKNCQGVGPQNIEEIAFNAVAVKWNPHEGPVRVNIAVHCLSTDFSNQKGVKGIPLHIQIDTYEHSLTGTQVVHRGFCQIKAFCDKGAERKTRDEERRRAAKVKPEDKSPVVGIPTNIKGRKKTDEAFHEPCEKSEFYSMADILTPPVFFNPTQDNSEYIHKSLVVGVVPAQEDEISSLPTCVELPDSCDDLFCSPSKRPRRDSNTSQQNFPKVLLYVRERHETAYTALMLEMPTLYGLLKSIEEKYSIQPAKMKNVYKKSKKGILVKLDDNIIRHYSNESTFIIEMNQLNEDKDQEIILTEIDPVAV